ncbi:4Fe-4S binding protein [Eggerthella sinensis]|uniref:4Fe-4S binding protein n=1 Tax=Eggerthella sinensis TaxID=242230 RepID=UPI00266CAAEA|nr:4Fe-4S binding protein [Eggerthella sinensis]
MGEKTIQAEEAAGGLERRDFLKGAAASAMGLCALGGMIGCAPRSANADLLEAGDASLVEPSDLTGWAGTPAHIAELGGSTMPLADLNRMRQEYVEAQTDFTCEDGTVVPAAFVKMRALIHTYGQGSGHDLNRATFRGLMDTLTEEEARAYIEMPMGVRFNAMDFQDKSGRTLEECKALCEHIADAGWLERYETSDGVSYHHIGYFQGCEEYPYDKVVWDTPGWHPGIWGADCYDDFGTSGTPNFYTVPCNREIVADETLPLHDDFENFVRGKNKYAIAPCLCRWLWVRDNCPDADLPAFEDFLQGNLEDYISPELGFRVETCLQFGDEAEYWMWKGMAREITEDQAVAYLKRSVDDGFILHSLFHQDHGTICSCHADSHCLIIDSFTAIGETSEEVATKPAFQQISHYMLKVDYDKCAKCGTCMDRCPLHAITMDGKGGVPQVSGRCERCGQCAAVCPQNARKLVRRPEDQILPLPATHLDDYNLKGAYRFEQGLIK